MKKIVLFLTCLLAFGPIVTEAAPVQDSQDDKRKEKKRPSDIVAPRDKGKNKGNGDGGGRNRDKGKEDGKSDKPKKQKPDDD